MTATLTSVSQDQRSAAISVNPATGEEIARYPHHDRTQQDAIIEAAWQGFLRWRAEPVEARAAVLARMAQVLRDRREALARLITTEMGKPVRYALAEVNKCATLCDWYAAHAAKLLADEPADIGADGKASIAYLPLGPVFAVMPWNFPLWQVLRAAVPIIAAGNAFLLKHADNVQGSALALADAFTAAGLPEGTFGVLNVNRHGLPAIIADKRVVGVTVTAGVAAGAAVASEAGRHIKKSLLELGGSDAFIVLADADLDKAVAAAVEARFQNNGQVCIAAKRIIVEEPIAAEFTRKFIEAAAALPQGDPLNENMRLGPMARARLREEVHGLVTDSVVQGATLALGGQIPEGPGAYYPATVLTGVTNDMAVARNETFGPVAPILVARDAEHAIAIANDSDFGLSGAIWSNNTSRAEKLARKIETGGVFINGISASDPRVPIGGIKQSGYGRELSHFGIREFCNAQLIWRRD